MLPMHASATPVIIITKANCVSFANLMFCTLIGYGQEELRGRKFKEFLFPSDVDCLSVSHSSIENNELSHKEFRCRFLRKDGLPVFASGYCCVLPGADVASGMMVMRCTEITKAEFEQEKRINA